jgi:hypothetical protein
MSTEIQSTSYARRPSAAVRWRDFCEQWRHSYLLLAVVFWFLWRASFLPMPRLENTRIAGGLHPLDVFFADAYAQAHVGPAFSRSIILRSVFSDSQAKHAIRNCRERSEFYCDARLRPRLGPHEHQYQYMIWIHVLVRTLKKPNQTLDRMTRSAVSRVVKCGRPWRALRHRSALRSAS